jgi:hypothetical protein
MMVRYGRSDGSRCSVVFQFFAMRCFDLLGFPNAKRDGYTEAFGAPFRAASGTQWDNFVVDNLKDRSSNIRQVPE